MATENLLHLTDDTFKQELTTGDTPIVIDFWAPWCGPCRTVGPAVEALAEELDGQVRFAKVNIDTAPETAGAYGVMSVPTFIVFKGETVVGQFSGSMPKDLLKTKVLELTR